MGIAILLEMHKSGTHGGLEASATHNTLIMISLSQSASWSGFLMLIAFLQSSLLCTNFLHL